MRTFALLLVVVVVPAGAQDLGETEFANTGAPEAQEPFLRGLLLLHSFEYDDAREAFQEARRLDPDFAMAAWGEAMTHNHPVWMRQDRDAALAALGGADAMPASARERAYLATLDALFRGDASKEDRDDAYAEAMADLAAAFPDDLDAAAFHALSLLGTAHEGRDFATYMRAAAVAEEVFDANPQHPGAAHYLIHAYDDPVHAPLGLRPARVYAEVAPAASHALHMPSHIYLALGMWDDVERMNRRSYEAAKAGTDRKGEPLNGHGWHALWWWHYAATQSEDSALADSLLAVAEAHHAGGATGTSLAHVVRIRAEHATAFDEWAVILEAPAQTAEAGLNTLAIDALARGLGQLQTGGDARATLLGLTGALAEADGPSWAARAAASQLEGAILLSEDDAGTALERLVEAARLEAEAPLMFGPPSPVVPAHEALGLAYLEVGRADDAAEAFRASLARQTGRRQSADGLERAVRTGRGAVPAGGGR
jgi:tetratricopeptide (TPR) repeat protein